MHAEPAQALAPKECVSEEEGVGHAVHQAHSMVIDNTEPGATPATCRITLRFMALCGRGVLSIEIMCCAAH
jgi:hypothetical protein